MAQRVGYWDNNATFDQGPFVLINASRLVGDEAWRVEVQYREAPSMPVLPDASIYKLMESLGWGPGKLGHYQISLAESVVDRLNEMVRTGEIVDYRQDEGRFWYVWPDAMLHSP